MDISAETLAAANAHTDKLSGDIGELKTTDKSSLVAAINEIFDILNNNEFIISETTDEQE